LTWDGAISGAILIFIFLILSMRYKYLGNKKPDYQYVTFYRLLGLIELPSIKDRESFVIKFTDLKAVNASFTTRFSHSGKMITFINDPQPYSFRWYVKVFFGLTPVDHIVMSWSLNPIEYWSFYVWYMDKNRPLPPGTAFDAYRKKDYERRKAEGFPAPLFESKIPTPEYNPGSDLSSN